MPARLRPSLPHGARGFSLGSGALIFARDKVVISTRDSRSHLTIHFGSDSGVLDLHETRTAPDGSKTHTTLFTISRERLDLLLREIAPDIIGCMKDLRRPLRIGWMARRRIAAVVGLIPQDNDLPKVTEKRRGKLIVNTDKLAAHASFPEFLEELHDLDNGANFTLFEARNPGSPRVIGIGFKYTDSMGHPRLTWFRLRDMAEVLKRLTVRFREAAGRYGDFHQPLPWLSSGLTV